MKEKYVKRMLPCGRFDIERIESWLQDMAGEGLHQARRKRVGCFAQGEPRQVRYRLQPKASVLESDLPEQSIRELCAEYGWEFVTELGEFYVYRAEDPNARELNTDPAVQAQAFRRLTRGWLGMNAVLIYLILNTLARFIREPMLTLVNYGVIYTVGFLLLLLFTAKEYALRLTQMRSIHRKLKRNEPLEHNKSWRKGAFWYRVGSVALCVFYVLVIATMVTQCTMQVAGSQKLEEYQGDPPFVTVQDLCPEGEYKADAIGLSHNQYEKFGNWAAPVVIQWQEYAAVTGPDGEAYSGFLVVNYYETASPWIAKALAQEFLRVAEKDKYTTEIGHLQLDLAYEAYYVGVTGRVLILCQDNRLMVAQISDDMQELWLELTLEQLK